MAFIGAEDMKFGDKKGMKPSHLTFRYGTSIMPTLVRGIIGNLPPHLRPIDPKKFDEEAKIDFAANFTTNRRMGKHLEIDGRYPSVSAMLGAAEEDLTKLYNWQSQKVLEMGYDGFRKYMSKRTTSGTNFHKTVEFLMKELQTTGKISDESCNKALMEKAMDENRGYIEGIIPFLKTIPKTDWMKLEKATKNHYYCFQGRFDAIIELEGEPTVADWKTVSTASYKHHGVNDLRRLYGVPLQVVAYIVSINTDPDYASIPKIKQGAVVLAYEDGRPAEAVIIHENELKEYYKILAEKINAFWWKMMHPKKGDKDISGNINFVYNPALRPPPPPPPKEPQVVEIEDDIIIETPSSQDMKPEIQEEKPKAEKYYAIFEPKTKGKNVPENADIEDRTATNIKKKGTVFGI
jgi:hypothetical protein